MLGVGPARPQALIVGEAPSRADVKAGEPISGPAGAEFAVLLNEAGLDRDRLFIINAIACMPNEPRREKEFKLATACCRPLLLATIAKLPPETPTLVMGGTAAAALDGHWDTSMAKTRGFIDYDWTLDDVKKGDE